MRNFSVLVNVAYITLLERKNFGYSSLKLMKIIIAMEEIDELFNLL
jgi:hypothetical protein